AARCLVTDYPRLPAGDRNVLRILFLDAGSRRDSRAGSTSPAHRVDPAIRPLEGRRRSRVVGDRRRTPERESLLRPALGGPRRRPARRRPQGAAPLRHEAITLRYSSSAIEEHPDLRLVLFTPAAEDSARRLAGLLEHRTVARP